MLNHVLRNILPPVVYRAGARVKALATPPKTDDDRLFDGDDAMFKELIGRAGVFAEYGCGASTVWVARHTSARILSTDSSEAWLDKVRQSCGDSSRMSLHHADVGAIGDWGRPVSYERGDNFSDYTDWIWSQDVSPDIVLVDGRFRVCCFLTSLLNAKNGAAIVFDDYTDRPHYHFVEHFVRPVRTCGRQALFSAPGKEGIDVPAVRKAIDQFRYVMD